MVFRIIYIYRACFNLTTFSVISLAILIVGFQIGVGGPFFALAVEIFPLRIRCIKYIYIISTSK